MTLRFGSIIIHKPDTQSETDSSNESIDDTEVAEIAEMAIVKYNNKKQSAVRRLERQKRAITKSRSVDSSSSSLNSSGLREGSFLRIMNADKSPPLVRSHYSQVEDRLQNKVLHNERKYHRTNSAEETDSDGERLGFKVLTSGSRTTDKAIINRRCASSVPDITTSFTTPFVPIIDDDAALRGLSRLFKTLNFTERLRQQKAEQERLNIHKLPNHLREELKHMYVY